MISSPRISFERTPFTLLLAATVVALEVVCQLEPSRRDYYYNDVRLGIFWPIWLGEIWRPFTTTLLHANLLHAAFNTYWLLVFGTAIEDRWGPWRTAPLVVLLAMVSSLDQYVLADYWQPDYQRQGGLVGLSGVVYGLFGLVWAGRRKVPGWSEVCPRDTVRLMIGWLIFCQVATWLEIMPIANAAHFGGLVQGGLIGLAAFAPRHRRWWLALAVLVAVAVLATLIAAPGHAGYEASRVYRASRAAGEP